PAASGNQADAPEVVVDRAEAPDLVAGLLECAERLLLEARLDPPDWGGGGARRRGGPPPDPAAMTRSAPSRMSAGDIMLSIRAPGTSGCTCRSTSPSMLFRWRSSWGTKSPEPGPRRGVRG